MPKFYCDYCDIYLAHSSIGGRRQHCIGRKHIQNKIDYYQKIVREQGMTMMPGPAGTIPPFLGIPPAFPPGMHPPFPGVPGSFPNFPGALPVFPGAPPVFPGAPPHFAGVPGGLPVPPGLPGHVAYPLGAPPPPPPTFYKQ